MSTKTLDEQEVAKTVEQLNKGLIAADKSILESIMHDDLSYGHSGGNVESKRDVIEAFVTGKYKFGKIDTTEQTIQLFGDTAVVRHKLYATTADRDKAPGEVYLFIITVWKKESNWKLVARQAVKNPAYMK